MDVKELKALVTKIIAEQTGKDVKEIMPEAKLIDDLKCDTLDLVELSMSLEEEFGIEIPDEDAEKLITVDDLVAYTFGLTEKKDDKPADVEPKTEPKTEPKVEPKVEPKDDKDKKDDKK